MILKVDNLKQRPTFRGMSKNLLRLIPLDDMVVFPGMELTLPLDPGTDTRVLLLPRHASEYAKVGVIANVSERVRLPGRGQAAALAAQHRAVVGAARPDIDGALRVEGAEH